MEENRRILQEDLEGISGDDSIPWEKLKNSTILITGATGLVGSALVRGISFADRRRDLNVRILAFGRNETFAEALTKYYGAEFFRQDIREPMKVEGRADYIFHCAAVTKSSEMVSNPALVIETSLNGTMNVLNLAREKSARSLVYMSSMEVYGAKDHTPELVTEDQLSYIDLKSARSCYPESKRMCECMCTCWLSQYGVPSKTARMSQIFGAGSPKDDPRVFAEFGRSVMACENIVLRTEGDTRGNYCYTADAVRALLMIALKGENGEAYNVVNPGESMAIRQMAGIVADRIGEGRVLVILNKPEDEKKQGYAPSVNTKLSAEKLENLGWRPKYGLEYMYRRMIYDWRESRGQPATIFL